jgi:hypothetical protein
MPTDIRHQHAVETVVSGAMVVSGDEKVLCGFLPLPLRPRA